MKDSQEKTAFINAYRDIAAQLPAAAAPTVIAVSKQQPIARIEAALAAGHRHFGENRVQDAQALWPDLKRRYPDSVLHLIGPLQSNKARDAVALFDVIHSVDRPKIAEALRREMTAQGKDMTCLIQVNTGEEPQKAGVAPQALPTLLETCRSIGLPVHGLMCIPPADKPAAPHFAFLRQLADRHGLAFCSMGMSGDYTLAVRFGATHLRIGTALFGERVTTSPPSPAPQ